MANAAERNEAEEQFFEVERSRLDDDPIDYEAMIRKLEAERSRIDEVIAQLRAIVGRKKLPGSVGASAE